MKGKLISISGIDGSGKSTQISNLKDVFTKEGFKCSFFQFDETFFGDKAKDYIDSISENDFLFTRLCIDWTKSYPLIREFVYNKNLQRKEVSKAVSLVFAGGSIQVYEECLKPALQKGINIICDRFWYDDIVYRSFWLEEDFIRNLYEDIPPADLPIFLDTDPNIIFERNTGRIDGKSPLMSNINSVFEINKRFHILAEKENMEVIDGNDTSENLTKKFREIIDKHILLQKKVIL